MPIETFFSQRRFRREQEEHRLAQRRLTEAEAAQHLASTLPAIPLATVLDETETPVAVGLDQFDKYRGHILVIAPHHLPWQEQLTAVLREWTEAALVIDPQGYQYALTGARRRQLRGPVYTLPGHHVQLGYYYRIWHEDEARRLQGYLMSPNDPRQQGLIDRTLSLFVACGHYGYALKRNLIQVLLDAAASNMLDVLTGLEAVPLARQAARQFTKGLSPAEAVHDQTTAAAFTCFSRQLQRYQEQFQTITMDYPEEVIGRDWVENHGTIYLTYDQESLAELKGLVAAIITGLVRYHLSHGQYRPFLIVIESGIARCIQHFNEFLRLSHTYGIVVLLYAQTSDEVALLSGGEPIGFILAHFRHQLWYGTTDPKTADLMALIYGTQLAATCSTCRRREQSEGEAEERPAPVTQAAMTPAEFMALSEDKVLVVTQRQQLYRFIGRRIVLADEARRVKAPPVPLKIAPEPRQYTVWVPPSPVTTGPVLPKSLPAGNGLTPPAPLAQPTANPLPTKAAEPKPAALPEATTKRGKGHWK
jgi:hypothetical protein